MPALKLTYFDAPGRAESVRIALFIAGVPFEDHRLTFPQFGALKAEGTLPLGSVPVLEVDGFTMTQTSAMLRYAARLADTGLYPTDPLQAFITDSALDTFNDTLSNALGPSMREPDMEKKLAMRKAFVAGPFTASFRYVESLLERSEGPFLIGKDLTIADLVIGPNILQIRSGGLDGIGPETLTPYPRLCALGEAFLAHPHIVAYHQR